MKDKLNRFWNHRLFGCVMLFAILIKVLVISVYEKIQSFFWKFNLGNVGRNLIIQKGVVIRHPKNITFADNVSIGRNCQITSEFGNTYLSICENTHIDKNCLLDFSGGLIIGKNVTLSQDVMIETHNHGYNPRSKPMKNPLVIQDNVWIGAKAIILPGVGLIGKNSIIGAGSVVTKEVAPMTIVAGNPARVIRIIERST